MTDKTPATAANLLHIDADAHGQRLDNFLLSRFRHCPRPKLYRLIRTGQVRVNSQRCKPRQRLCGGDLIRLPPFLLLDKPLALMPSPALQASLMQRILYEDEDLLAIDKPSGLAVHGGSGLAIGLIGALRMMRSDLAELRLVHRLDRDTSGCLLLAKNRTAVRRAIQALAAASTRKCYLGLVRGHWRHSTDPIVHRLARSPSPRLGMVVDEQHGRVAQSQFRAVEHFRGFSLIEVVIRTGRTHQIRVQAAELGHPIAGDPKYGDAEVNHRLRSAGLRRLFLHASRLELRGEIKLKLHAELPSELVKLRAQLAANSLS